ncbi:MAG: putative DNA binding domain-containing protein [Bernardetiaceae bacterium]|nr:putative DNA binding domain-containing protein [Bernardetiaceae bacterium]
MSIENQNKDYKSLRKAIGNKANHRDLAEICVCFANAQGGDIIIGIEDKNDAPPPKQKINQEDINALIKSLRSLTDGVGIVNPEIITHDNGGEYFVLKILPSMRVIATTSSGKVFIRISDNCYPVGSDELTNLASEKTAFQWEIISTQKIILSNADSNKIKGLLSALRASDKVSNFIKEKLDEEMLSFYQLLSPEGFLTNLGVLWLGKPAQIARLSYPVTIQYIVYNNLEEKIRKKEWHFHLHNPKELLLEIEKEAVELTYSTELPDGLFRKNIRQYAKEVVRELLVNAIAHKKYTISGDIFIEVYPDRLKITNPGSLPLGISSKNILHERQRRNPHLIQLMSDLRLMEGEGSGYDLVFEKLARDAKPMPEVESDFTKVSVTVYSKTMNSEVVSILDYIAKHYTLTQKEYITLGIIASQKKMPATQLASHLLLAQEDRTRTWIGTLLEKEIIVTHGEKKGTQYLLNPKLFEQAKLDITPSLKTMEPYMLEALIKEDLKYNGISSMSDIKKRIKGVSETEVQKAVYRLAADEDIIPKGAKRNRTYELAKKK